MNVVKKIIKFVIVYSLYCPLTIASAIWLKYIRTNFVGFNFSKFKVFPKIFEKIGVFPIIDHYYEPLFRTKKLKHSLRVDRPLKGINFNTTEQLSILEKFHFNKELIELSKKPKDRLTYSFDTASYCSGDAEYLYNVVRLFKPKRIIEVGCGDSTLIIEHAINNNKKENSTYDCKHICIEPFHHPWLETLNIEIKRDLIENVDLNLFKILDTDDILFIDSSHMIRPQGDVLFEILELLPTLNSGVIIHFHDIFTPKDYLNEWMFDGKNFWNEQYLFRSISVI